MTRYVVDAGVVLRMAEEGVVVGAEHELLAPTLVRSQTLSLLHQAVHRGDLTEAEGRSRLAAVNGVLQRSRLLGDAVLRRTAWDVATRLGWASTEDAEYVALTRLQGDALVTLDADLARRAADEVRVDPYDDLTR
ncbi:type II toxin-antitoxin system VapC family toxin [Actinotalea sp. Marseille-Q4924]|uniref:type II toxin-antitoxin system VapC family toxin n=1 Tax=Actinotalea sp. Marseille-Q4924 TaxID=2866571 RepID=UPI001CE3CE0D|nr:type II toxin-antitoxin system VapC family toxin [Actinotalea sp. Marseille-Q4924]